MLLFRASEESFLEVCVFLRRAVKSPQVRRVNRASKSKVAHVIQLRRRDEVEAQIADSLQEAYDYSGAAARAAHGGCHEENKEGAQASQVQGEHSKRR